jgi:hypothetical protein
MASATDKLGDLHSNYADFPDGSNTFSNFQVFAEALSGVVSG